MVNGDTQGAVFKWKPWGAELGSIPFHLCCETKGRWQFKSICISVHRVFFQDFAQWRETKWLEAALLKQLLSADVPNWAEEHPGLDGYLRFNVDTQYMSISAKKEEECAWGNAFEHPWRAASGWVGFLQLKGDLGTVLPTSLTCLSSVFKAEWGVIWDASFALHSPFLLGHSSEWVLDHNNSSGVATVSPGSCSVAALEKGICYYYAYISLRF